MHDVADELGISLAEIHAEFPDKESLVDAWFDSADKAALRDAADEDYSRETDKAKLSRSIMAWLNALSRHRRVTKEMLLVRMEPGHLHIQIPSLIRLSRTVQWFREAAGRDAVFMRRALEEAALTSLFVATFMRWLNDDSTGFENTRRFLTAGLNFASNFDGSLNEHHH